MVVDVEPVDGAQAFMAACCTCIDISPAVDRLHRPWQHQWSSHMAGHTSFDCKVPEPAIAAVEVQPVASSAGSEINIGQTVVITSPMDTYIRAIVNGGSRVYPGCQYLSSQKLLSPAQITLGQGKVRQQGSWQISQSSLLVFMTWNYKISFMLIFGMSYWLMCLSLLRMAIKQ